MANTEHASVAVQDFVARQTRAKLGPALAELIWNGLHADATEVTVEFAHDNLAGSRSKIVVCHNSVRFCLKDADSLFRISVAHGSVARQTKRESRMVHGQKDRGRYKTFALDRSVRWKKSASSAPESEQRHCYRMKGSHSRLGL